MRNKYLLLSLLVAATGSLFAQSLPPATPSSPEMADEFITKDRDAKRYYSNSAVLDTSLADLIWFSDFSNANQWTTINQGINGWGINTSVIGWFYTSFTSTSGAPFAEMQNGDATQGGTQPAEHILKMAVAADVSANTGGAYVTFQQLTSRFYDSYYIEASNNGTTWTVIGNNEHLFPRTAGNDTPGTNNPEYNALYIPASIAGAGSDSLWVRWRWIDDANGIAYGWYIDDVSIYTNVDHDLDLFRAYNSKNANGGVDSNSFMFYSQIPLKQAQASDFRPAAAIFSNGNSAVTDATLNVSLSGGSYTSSSAGNPLLNGEVVVTQVADDMPLTGTGNYTLTYSVSAGSGTDAVAVNNTKTWGFNVNQNTYAYDDAEPQGASWFGDAGYTQCLYFDNFTTDTIIGIQGYFPQVDFTSGTYGLKYGQTLGAYIYANEAPFGSNLLASNPFFEVSNGTAGQFVNNWVTIPIEFALDPSIDSYYACFKAYDDEVPYAYDYGVDGYSFVDPDNAGTWYNPVDFFVYDTLNLMPYIRVRMYNADLCASTNILIGGTVTDEIDPCATGDCFGSIVINTVNGGTAPYSYIWSGPGGYSSTDKDIDDIEEKGVYTLVVTDVNGCTGETSFTVAGNVGVEQVSGVEFAMYPNPAKDFVSLSFAKGGNYDVTVTNIKGELMLSTSLNTGAGETQTINLESLASGVYLVKVAGKHASTTQEIVIK